MHAATCSVRVMARISKRHGKRRTENISKVFKIHAYKQYLAEHPPRDMSQRVLGLIVI